MADTEAKRQMMQALDLSIARRAMLPRADNTIFPPKINDDGTEASADAQRRDAAIQRAMAEGERRKEARRKRIEFEQETGIDLPHDASLEKPT